MPVSLAHPAAAVRAYLKAAGLPEFDQKLWDTNVRPQLLGVSGSDPRNQLEMNVFLVEARKALEQNVKP